MQKLAPEQRIHAITRLLPFILPKKQETPEDKPDEVIRITIDLGNGPKNPFQLALEKARESE